MTEPQVVRSSVATELVPSPMEYAAILPPGYTEDERTRGGYPVLLILHGGLGSREVTIKFYLPILTEMWATGALPPTVVVAPSATHHCRYIDAHNGKERWETFLTGPFLKELRSKLAVTSDPARTMVMGTSMGGIGSLVLAFRNPELFGAVAAMEGSGPPIGADGSIAPIHEFYRDADNMKQLYGDPRDPKFWAEHHPALLARDRTKRIIDSGLAIFIESGDEDMVNMHHAMEFLHRTLWDAGIRHEYQLTRGGNHVGKSFPSRRRKALDFLNRHLTKPWANDTDAAKSWERYGALYRTVVGREGSVTGDWPFPFAKP